MSKLCCILLQTDLELKKDCMRHSKEVVRLKIQNTAVAVKAI